MDKQIKVKDTVYDVIGSFDFKEDRILKLKNQENQKISYLKTKITDQKNFNEVKQNNEKKVEIYKQPNNQHINDSNNKKNNTKQPQQFQNLKNKNEKKVDDSLKVNEKKKEKEHPRNKQSKESIQSYFKYLDEFYRN